MSKTIEAAEKNSKSSLPAGSLTTTLAFAFAVLSVATLLVAGGLQLYSDLRTQQLIISNNQKLIAQGAAGTVSNFIQDKFKAMETVIWFSDPLSASSREQKQILGSLLGLQPAFRQLVLLDNQNRELARASRLSRAASGELAERLESETLTRILRGKRQIGQVFIDPVTSEPMTGMTVPVYNVFGDFQGTLAAEVNLKFMWDLVDRLKVGERGLAYVVDKQGNLLAFHDAAQVLKGENVRSLEAVETFIRQSSVNPGETSTYRGITGSLVVGTYVPLQTPDWAVVTELPWSEAYREVIRDAVISVAIIVIIGAAAGLIGVHVARRLSVPLVNLMETATRISGGELELQAEVSGPLEVAGLARAFNSMTARLRETLQGLEQRVSERTQQLQEALSFQKQIVTASSSGIAAYDSTGQCVLANEAAAKMINASLEQVLSQNYHHINSWKDSGLYEAALEVVRSGSSREKDVHVTSTFGRDAWLNCRFTTFESGGQLHLLLTINDMTERMQAESEIRDLNRQLQAQAESLTAANRELEAFSYSVSHDLRSPLRAIDGYTRILSEEYSSSLDAEGRRLCAVVTNETRRMGQLIEDLLAFSRAGRAEMHPSPVDMEALARSAFEELTMPEDRQRIEFKVGELPAAEGDPILINQVWTNLLANAIKFSSRQERALIEVEGRQTDDEALYFVRDNGAGFPMKYADKLFGVFERLHHESDFQGTGVGLAIVQRIVNRHGGRIWAESKANQGATFYFTLRRTGLTPEK
jgi:PAS domain S-box-containing protein